MFKNLPEATKEQERFLHMAMILYTEFRKNEMGSRKVTLQRKVLSSHATQQKQNSLPPWFLPSEPGMWPVTSDWERRGGEWWQFISSGPLNVPSPCCWHSSLGWVFRWVLSHAQRHESQQPPVKGFIFSFYLLCCALLGSFQHLHISHVAPSKINDLEGLSAQPASTTTALSLLF